MPNKHPGATLSVVVTAHTEGFLLHKTLLSVMRAVERIGDKYSTELILHVDNPSDTTEEYLKVNNKFLRPFKVFRNNFADAGMSRNFAIQKASGTFVTFIDGDDLVSRDWFMGGLDYLTQYPGKDVVVHAESTLEFDSFQALVKRHTGMGREIDSLLSVYANRWNAVIMTSRDLLQREPYVQTAAGYGFEDWQLMNRLIALGVENVLIPETAIFVRRKAVDSRWAAHKQSMSVLLANPMLSFPYIRALKPDTSVIPAPSAARITLKSALAKHPQLHRAAAISRKAARRLHGSFAVSETAPQIPSWLLQEWRDIQIIDKALFPTPQAVAQTQFFDSITPDHWQTGLAYKRIVDRLHFDAYDYILFVPWLIAGGADKYALHYANKIQSLRPDKHVLVVATLDSPSPWQDKLDPQIDFLPFGEETKGLGSAIQQRLLEQLIENSHASFLHIINSELAYDFVSAHRDYITSSGKHLVLTSFSQSIDATGRIFGYSHTHVPQVYELADLVTSDNQAVIDMWVSEYGFDPAKLLLHRQPVTMPEHITDPPVRPRDRPLRILWAARLSPEKVPELVPQIGQLLHGFPVAIDMYGNIDPGFDTSFLKTLPPTVTYKGPFSNFSALSPQDYDVLLYTSLFDGMPNVLLEASEVGLAIISSNVGGIGELIKDHDTGMLVHDIYDAQAYANAIKLLMDDALRQKLVRNLRQEVKDSFSPDLYDTQVGDMLKRLKY